MYIVPYIYSPTSPISAKPSMFPFQMTWIFLLHGGSTVWKTDTHGSAETVEDIVQSYLLENGFHGTPFYNEKEDILFYKIDPIVTKMKDFYFWNEFIKEDKPIPSTLDIWRPFFFLGGRSVDELNKWGWNSQFDTIQLGDFGSFQRIATHIPSATA